METTTSQLASLVELQRSASTQLHELRRAFESMREQPPPSIGPLDVLQGRAAEPPLLDPYTSHLRQHVTSLEYCGAEVDRALRDALNSRASPRGVALALVVLCLQ